MLYFLCGLSFGSDIWGFGFFGVDFKVGLGYGFCFGLFNAVGDIENGQKKDEQGVDGEHDGFQ